MLRLQGGSGLATGGQHSDGQSSSGEADSSGSGDDWDPGLCSDSATSSLSEGESQPPGDGKVPLVSQPSSSRALPTSPYCGAAGGAAGGSSRGQANVRWPEKMVEQAWELSQRLKELQAGPRNPNGSIDVLIRPRGPLQQQLEAIMHGLEKWPGLDDDFLKQIKDAAGGNVALPHLPEEVKCCFVLNAPKRPEEVSVAGAFMGVLSGGSRVLSSRNTMTMTICLVTCHLMLITGQPWEWCSVITLRYVLFMDASTFPLEHDDKWGHVVYRARDKLQLWQNIVNFNLLAWSAFQVMAIPPCAPSRPLNDDRAGDSESMR